MNALVEYGQKNGYRVEVATDAPCHLWLRWSRNKPQTHPRAVKVRGVWLMGDVYYCFTAYFDIEQEEAGDTLTHTFIMAAWPACETRWFYLWGKIGGVESPSESPFWGRHLFFTYHAYSQQVSHDNDVVNYYSGSITSAPPSGPVIYQVGRLNVPLPAAGGALRFRNYPLPKYAEILESFLWLKAATNTLATPVHAQIASEDDPSPNDFYAITTPEFLARWATRTGIADWDNIQPWYHGTWYLSPSFAPAIQYIVNLTGWAHGNPMVLFFGDLLLRTPGVGTFMRRPFVYVPVPAWAPYLIVNYNHWQVEEVIP